METVQTRVFSDWLAKLRDRKGQEKIRVQIERLEAGNFGKVEFFDGWGELKIDFGPGYRVYFTRRGKTLILLLAGGDKSTQRRDIHRVKEMLKQLE